MAAFRAAFFWSSSFDGLPKYDAADGHEVAYGVTEAEVSGVDASHYTTAVSGDAASGFTITNTNAETVTIEGAKTWDDDGDRDGVRPASITVNLMRDGAKADSRTVTPDASGAWAYSFTGLPKYAADGHEYAYTVTEEAVPNYATEVNDTDIVNSYTPGKTSVTVTKAWADANDQDGIRPASVKAQLYADGKPLGDPVELSEANGWTHTWTGLFMKEAGKDVVYEVKEVSVPKDYEASVAGDAKAGYTVTNTHEPETVSVPVAKRWVGGEGGEGCFGLSSVVGECGLPSRCGWGGESFEVSFVDVDGFVCHVYAPSMLPSSLMSHAMGTAIMRAISMPIITTMITSKQACRFLAILLFMCSCFFLDHHGEFCDLGCGEEQMFL